MPANLRCHDKPNHTVPAIARDRVTVARDRPRGHRQLRAESLATRQLLTQLRDQGIMMGGPPPFAKQDRSLFLQKLDETINAIRRARPA